MKKLCFISMLASPHQVKFCYALQKYFDTEFWFYEYTGDRQAWWAIPLGDKCKIIRCVFFKWRAKYLTFSHLRMLNKFDPDVVMLGGFSVPANYLAYVWAKWHCRKTVIFTERSRKASGELRRYGMKWRLLRFLYRKVDLVLVSSEDVVPQFRDTFCFGNKVVAGRYAADIDAYFSHPVRKAKAAYTFLFPNRLTSIYDPLKAITIFRNILEKYPGSKLKMNASGEMFDVCKTEVAAKGSGDSVEFLTDITSWSALNEVYRDSDIMILPASFSNGNFTILEAMASGMGIVISNRILGTSSYFTHDVNGFCCEPTEEAFVGEIMKYITNPIFFQQQGVLNKAVVKPLSLEGTAELTARILHERKLV